MPPPWPRFAKKGMHQVNGHCELPLHPKEVLMNVSFALLYMEMVMDRTSSTRSQRMHVTILMNMETISILHNILVVAFGQLQLYLIVSLHPPPFM
jgi:hypothetical protein